MKAAYGKLFTQNDTIGRNFHRIKNMLAKDTLDVTGILRRTRPGQPLIQTPKHLLPACVASIVFEGLLNLGQRLTNAHLTVRRITKTNSAGVIPVVLSQFIQIRLCPESHENPEHLARTNTLLKPFAVEPSWARQAIEPSQ